MLLVIDANSLMHRAFHAIPPLTTASGVHTNAVYGFMSMLLRLLKDHRPDHVAVAFDMHGPTFRHTEFEAYKAGRSKTPDELISQFPLLHEVLESMNIVILERQTFEADDILGTLSVMATREGLPSLLVTGDRDALQLVSELSTVLYTRRGITDTQLLDADGVKEKMGVTPERITDLKGLMGDSSDNIPGVPGVGEKTAVRLLEQFETLENVLENAANAGGKKLCESLVTYRDQAVLSKRLATIDTAIDNLCELDDLAFSPLQAQGGEAMLLKLEMGSLVTRLRALGTDAGAPSAGQTSSPTQAPPPTSSVAAPQRLSSLTALSALLEPLSRFALYVDDRGLTLAGDGVAVLLPFAQSLLETGFDEGEIFACLSPALSDTHKQTIVYDLKALNHRLAYFDLPPVSGGQDVMLMAYVEDPANGQDGLMKQCDQHGIIAENADAGALLMLYDLLYARLSEQDMLSVYEDIELPLCAVLFEMEQRGFCLDLPVLEELRHDYGQQIKALNAQVIELAGHDFNLNSPKQVAQVLFEELQLPASRKTKSGYSTDAAALEAIAQDHPIVNALLSYRKLAKLQSTYLEGLANVAQPVTGKVHTRFTQNVTATGRISSIEPNLQNIPVRTDIGREIRRAFIASGEDRVLITADYSQIELRLLAHMAQEQHMIEVFDQGGDIHAATAAQVFGLAQENVSRDQRTAAKAVNFGIIYGISDFGLARNLGIGRAQAGDIIKRYLATYSQIDAYMQGCIEFAREHGYVQTLYNRRRYLPQIHQKNYALRSFGERAAMNAPIQGTAADIIKVAMIKVERALHDRFPDTDLILQVHDELIVDCPRTHADEVSELMRRCMEDVIDLCVPLVVEVGVGKNWLEAK